ncbi:MAG: hypothetical protein ACI93R_003586 [Flavobacteriales bacterium]|jgi:hypothetical protein
MAIVFDILSRDTDIGGLASLNRFGYKESGIVNSDVVITDDTIIPYCLDSDSECLIFTQMPLGFDLTSAPFIFISQKLLAIKLIAVPYAELDSLADKVAMPNKLVFIQSTGRAGSTLISQVLNRVDGVCSFSEPDFFTNFIPLAYHAENKKSLVPLLQNCLKLFIYPFADQTVSIKFRSDNIDIAELFHLAFTEAKHIFIYRNAIDWSASWWNILENNGMANDGDVDFIGDSNRIAGRSDHLQACLPEGVVKVPGLTGFLALWLFNVDAYLRAVEHGVPFFTFKFEDLLSDRRLMLEKLFEYIDIPLTQLDRALIGFEKHSQKRGEKFDGGNALAMTQEQINTITQLLAQHPRSLTFDETLTGTVHPQC